MRFCIAMQKQEYQLISIAGGGFVGKRRSTFKGWRMSGMPFSSGELMRELLKSGKIELNWFKKETDQEKYLNVCMN